MGIICHTYRIWLGHSRHPRNPLKRDGLVSYRALEKLYRNELIHANYLIHMVGCIFDQTLFVLIYSCVTMLFFINCQENDSTQCVCND